MYKRQLNEDQVHAIGHYRSYCLNDNRRYADGINLTDHHLIRPEFPEIQLDIFIHLTLNRMARVPATAWPKTVAAAAPATPSLGNPHRCV